MAVTTRPQSTFIKESVVFYAGSFFYYVITSTKVMLEDLRITKAPRFLNNLLFCAEIKSNWAVFSFV